MSKFQCLDDSFLKPTKQDVIDDINDELDSLSPETAVKILGKLSLADLLTLSIALDDYAKKPRHCNH